MALLAAACARAGGEPGDREAASAAASVTAPAPAAVSAPAAATVSAPAPAAVSAPAAATVSAPAAATVSAPAPASESASAAASALASAAPLETSALPAAAAEPKRTRIGRIEDDRALVPHRDVIRAHWKGDVPSPLELQSVALTGGRRAVLLYGRPKHRDPLILALDPQGALLWTKERPLAGIAPEVSEMVIAPGPEGEVALLWFDTPTRLVALRKWAADGSILADFELLDGGPCEALSAMYWPGRGWVVVASQDGAARAQLLDEGGQLAWGDRGLGLPWSSRASAPASIAPDTDGSVMLFQIGQAEGATGKRGDRLLVARYNAPGAALWTRPVDLGAAPPGAAQARIAAARVADGVVRVALGAGPSRLSADVTSEGAISRAVKR
jgi:hypothetical protein